MSILLWVVRIAFHILFLAVLFYFIFILFLGPVGVASVEPANPDSGDIKWDDTPVESESTPEPEHISPYPTIQATPPLVPPALENPPIPPVSAEVTTLEKEKDNLQKKVMDSATLHEQDEAEINALKEKIEELQKHIEEMHMHPAKPKVSYIMHTDLESAIKESKDTGKPVAVLFTQDTCQPCKVIESNVLPTEKFQNYSAEHFVFALINTNEYPQTAKQFRVDRTPRLVMYMPGHPETLMEVTPATNLDSFLLTLQEWKG